jgi:RNA polymerase sigma-70 factor (ECF subfamily)
LLSNVNFDEKALLLSVADGNENAFSLLFKTYCNHLGDFILRITASQSLTEEIVQDVFLKIWLNRQALTQVNCFKAYLYVIARNHAFNCLKQLAREKSRQQEWAYHFPFNTSDTEETPDLALMVERAVEQLPPRQKNVYLLSRKEGISQEGIAQRLNISHQTVKKHMVLALRFLRNYLRTQNNLLLLLLQFFLRY